MLKLGAPNESKFYSYFYLRGKMKKVSCKANGEGGGGHAAKAFKK
jgi:hypothetical protein